jgi:hypothetical protein
MEFVCALRAHTSNGRSRAVLGPCWAAACTGTRPGAWGAQHAAGHACKPMNPSRSGRAVPLPPLCRAPSWLRIAGRRVGWARVKASTSGRAQVQFGATAPLHACIGSRDRCSCRQATRSGNPLTCLLAQLVQSAAALLDREARALLGRRRAAHPDAGEGGAQRNRCLAVHSHHAVLGSGLRAHEGLLPRQAAEVLLLGSHLGAATARPASRRETLYAYGALNINVRRFRRLIVRAGHPDRLSRAFGLAPPEDRMDCGTWNGASSINRR